MLKLKYELSGLKKKWKERGVGKNEGDKGTEERGRRAREVHGVIPPGYIARKIRRFRGVQHFGVSGPHRKKSCLGPHIKYIAPRIHKKNLIMF